MPLAHVWRTRLAEVATVIFALSGGFRRDTPNVPSGIALGLAIIGLGILF